MNYKQEFEDAKQIAIKAGERLIKEKNLEVLSSQGKDTKAKADIETEKFILNEIKRVSDFPLLSEESYQNYNNVKDVPYWIIDPIDGTLNYTRTIHLSCVSIALWVNNSPIFGVIYDFNRSELIYGYVDAGAWLNDIQLKAPISRPKSESILGTGISTYIDLDNDTDSLQEFVQKITSYKKVRLLGSAALSVAYVALDRFDAYMEKDIKLWDVAGGISIIHSLGIKYEMQEVSDFGYDVFVYNHT
ncbi:MAG: inositol monophosphatase [Balneola sp.]|nr:MAG: inositol monophosphatase [Balneola sp.]